MDENENPNLFRLLDVLTRQLQAEAYLALVLHLTSEPGRGSFASVADEFQVDGLVFVGTTLTDELVRLAQAIRTIPLVVLGRSSDPPDIHVVSTDGIRAGLAELGLELSAVLPAGSAEGRARGAPAVARVAAIQAEPPGLVCPLEAE